MAANDATLDDAITAAKQFATIAADVTAKDSSRDTPCTEWNVEQLLEHVHVATLNFTDMAGGGEADWERSAPASSDRAADVRTAVDDLVAAWGNADPAAAEQAGMAVPEYAVHTWDLASALDRSTDELDQTVADSALTFMRGQLTDDKRAPMFGPEQEAPAGANSYDRLAAFAGRKPATR